jgi:hypothetical protein
VRAFAEHARQGVTVQEAPCRSRTSAYALWFVALR